METGLAPWKRVFVGLSFAIAVAILTACCAACAESSTFASNRGSLAEGVEGVANAAFAMNGRSIKLELYINLTGTGATIWIDHPDGRTTEAVDVPGPGIRELLKEFPKEPGNWGLRLESRGGSATYWVALHDRRKYIGPDDEARSLVEGK
jgi:hypothetical protein